MDYETGLANLTKLNAWHKDQDAESVRNEATTRLHLIDTLLFECLAWDKKSNCIAEERLNGHYSDYTLSARQRLLIVEAKKEGIYFNLPAGHNKLVYPISFFEKNHKEVHSAISQAIDYCLQRGTPMGAVSNGHQIIAFLGSRVDGLPPLDGSALVFSSLDVMQGEFFTLWQCLSKPGAQSLHLSIILQAGGPPPPPEKLAKRVPVYPGFKNRNSLQTDLQILAELIIQDISPGLDKVDFLRQCYCESGALSQYAVINKSILQTRYSLLFEKATGGPSLAPATAKEKFQDETLAASVSKRPILLLGDVGVGKSIFLDHFIYIEAREVVQNAMVFYIDFGSKPTIVQELRPYLVDETQRQLLETHGVDIEDTKFVHGVYHGQLQRFERGIHSELKQTDPDAFLRKKIEFLEREMANAEHHLSSCLDHLSRGRKKQLIIILDNIDQRKYEFQEEVFLIAQSIAHNWPAVVYVAIRPETYYKSKTTGSLTAYHPRAFPISPPRIDRVVLKRLEYAISFLEKKKSPQLNRVEEQFGTLKTYLVILRNSFDENFELMEFVDNVSGGNVRLALEFIHAFIGSGHVNTEKILTNYQQTGGYTVPLHEFLRAVIFGDHEHYDPSSSQIVNVFDVSSIDPREHFLLPILLAQLESWSTSAGNDGYVADATVNEFCQSLGFQPAQIKFALMRAITKKLIETHTKENGENWGEAVHWRITSVGAYYFKKLMGRFEYLDAMIVDTPILDPSIRGRISDVGSIEDRLTRGKIFLSYLNEQWHLVAGLGTAFDFTPLHEALLEKIRKISQRVSANKHSHN